MHHLKTITALAPVLGLSLLAQQPQERAKPTPVSEALLAMRAWHRPALCFVRRPDAAKRFDAAKQAALRESFRKRIEALTASELTAAAAQVLPDTTPMATPDQELATSIAHLLLTPDLPLFLALSDCVLVVARAEAVGALPGETLLLLGPDGKRRTGAAVDLLDDALVHAAIEPWTGGREELERRVRLLGPFAAPAAVRADLETAVAGDPASLGKHWARALPVLRTTFAAASGSERERIAPAIRSAAEKYDPQRLTVVPIGVASERRTIGDTCCGCGMAATRLEVLRVLRLLD